MTTPGSASTSCGRPFGDLAALLQRDRLIGKLGEKRHLVVDDAQGRSMRPQIAEHALQIMDFVIAEPGCRFIEQQQLRLAHHRHRDAKHLFLAIG